MLTVGSLFAGIGGIDLGLERAGMRCVWQVEKDDYARRVLEKHWPAVSRWDDVRTFPPEPAADWSCDLICGGFPCQDISHAGKGAGIDGPKSGLWREFIRVVRVLQPRIVVMENTPALAYRGLPRILGELAALGFDAEWDCLPASAFGAPFEGDRLFICATDRSRRQDQGRVIFRQKPEPGTWWLSEPGIRRVVNGVSGTVGGGGGNVEVAALANAVVPAVAEWIGRRIIEAIGD